MSILSVITSILLLMTIPADCTNFSPKTRRNRSLKMYQADDKFSPILADYDMIDSYIYPPVLQWSLGNNLISSFPTDKAMKGIMGGKGANLERMTAIGLNVPPGFTVTTEVCASFQASGKLLTGNVWSKILVELQSLETKFGREYGDVKNPLLLSVRSGAAISMPGMMDTVLNLGITDDTIPGLSKQFGRRFALDSYRRLLNMFGEVVLGIPYADFERELADMKKLVQVTSDSQLSAEDLDLLVIKYKDVYRKHGKEFPQNPITQLFMSVTAVFNSWDSDRCRKYREVEKITDILGTAIPYFFTFPIFPKNINLHFPWKIFRNCCKHSGNGIWKYG